MQTDIKDVTQCVKELTITIAKEDAMNDYRVVVKDFAKYVAVPGFRKGKAPTSMVVNMFGSRIKESYLQEKVVDYFKEATEKLNINPMYQPEILSIKWEPNEELVAVYLYEVFPEIKVTTYTGLEVPYTPLAFDESMVDEALRTAQKQHPIIEKDIETIDTESYVIFTGSIIDDKGQKEPLPPQLTNVQMSEHSFGEAFEQAVCGAKKGDQIETEVTLTDDVTKRVKLNVQSIIKVTYPEIDDEFAKKCDFENLAAMRDSYCKAAKDRDEQELQRIKRSAMNSALIKANNFDLPPTGVDEFAKKMAQPYADYYNQPVEKLATEFHGMAFYEMKTYYIIEELIRELNQEITEQDEQALIAEMANELKLTVEEYLERNPDVTKQDDFVEKVRKEKVYSFLFENNTFVPKEEADVPEIAEETSPAEEVAGETENKE